MLYGIDAAGYQTDNDINICKPSFLIAKASEGIGFDANHPGAGFNTHAHQVALAREKGWLVGHYGFAWPTNNPEQEADYFLKCANPQPGDLLCLDLEKNLGSQLTRLSFALRWAARIRETGASPVLYSYPDYMRNLLGATTPDTAAELRTMPLWIATDGYAAGTVPAEYMFGWQVWTAHQYAAGPYADRDVFNGDAATWHKLGVPGAKPAPPKPPTHPTAPKIVEDGNFGPKSVDALEQYAGHEPHGVISSQPESNRPFASNLLAVQWLPDGEAKGSAIAVWVQHRVGAHEDGKWGPLTTEAVQRRLHVNADGRFGPVTARALQHSINDRSL